MKKIAILGSTGSIGTQSLDVARQHGYEVSSLAAWKNIELLERQIREFKPKTVAVFDESAGEKLKIAVADTDTKVTYGKKAVVALAAETDADTVINAIVGIAGLEPTLAAANAKKQYRKMVLGCCRLTVNIRRFSSACRVYRKAR